MSKLEELMALADAFWEHGTNEALAHADGAGYDGERVNAARAALQDALKAVVEDAERYRHIRPMARVFGLNIDGMHSWVMTGQFGRMRGATLDAAIDAARKP